MSRRRERPYDDVPDDAEDAREHKSRRTGDGSPAAVRRSSRHRRSSRSRSPSHRRRSQQQQQGGGGSPPPRSNRPSRRRTNGSSGRSRSPSPSGSSSSGGTSSSSSDGGSSSSRSPSRSRSPPRDRAAGRNGSDRQQQQQQQQQELGRRDDERGGGGSRRSRSRSPAREGRRPADRDDRAVGRDGGRERDDRYGDRERDRYQDRDRYGDREREREREGGRYRESEQRCDSDHPARGGDVGGSRGQWQRGGPSRGNRERWGYSAYLQEEGGDRGQGGEGGEQQGGEKRKGRGFAGRGGAAAGGDSSAQRRSRSGSREREAAAAADDKEAPAAAAAADGAGAAAEKRPAGEQNGAAAAGAAAGAGDKDATDFLQKKAAVAGRAGGAYIPPFRLARMMAEIDDKNSAAAQKLSWEALRKSLNGLINKVNAPNMKDILPELFAENLLRGRGLFCQALMKAQLASPAFTPLYAALLAVVNTKFPEIGELLLHRVIAQFKRAYKRNDKPITIAAAKFLAHLINQGVLHEVMALEVLILLLENPSDDSVEMAVDFCKEVGAHLQDVAPAGLHSVFERFRAILHEGAIDKRCQYMIEGLFAVRKAGFAASGHPAVKPELDLVEDEDQITHEMSLEDKHDPQAILNVFREDPEYAQHEAQYRAIARELLGEGSEEGEEEEEGAGGEGSSEEEEEDSEGGEGGGGGGGNDDIADETGTDVVNLRRTIYLTIMSSLDFEEAGHKLMKIQLRPGQECEIPIMIIECCSQEKTFVRYYALLGARFCMLRKEFQATFEDCFAKQYAIIHRLETNKLRNVAKLFAHLLANDGISWGVLGCIRLTEDDTTSSSRIFIKYLFQELSEYMGLVKLNERLAEPSLQQYFLGIFPQDTMQNMRFSINFFTSIGLGGITDRQRELYKQMPRIMAERKAAEDAARKAAGIRSDSGSSASSSSSSGTSSSGSDSSSSGSSSSSSSDSESEDSRDRRRRRQRRSSSRDRRRR